MQLDWITVGAQIVNFLILVWLLHRFLYGPITRAMSRREEKIKSQLDEAKEQKEKAEQKQQELDEKLGSIEQERKDRLDAAREEAAELKRDLERKARDEVDNNRKAWIAEIAEDREEFLLDLREKMSVEFHHLTEDCLATLAGTSLVDRMGEVFLERLRDMDGGIRDQLLDAARNEGRVEIEAGHELDAGLRRRLTRYVHDNLGADIEVDYKSDVQGLVGIRLRVGSASVGWSVNEYVDRFAERLAQSFPKKHDISAEQEGEEKNERRSEPEESGASDAKQRSNGTGGRQPERADNE